MGGGGGGGFFDNPVQNIGTGIGAVIGGPVGAVHGALTGNIIGSHGAQANPPPGMDPRLAELQKKRVDEAKEFRANIPGVQQDMNRDLETHSRRDLASDIATNKASYNRRGLLGSGMNQAADAGAAGSQAVSLAKSKQQMFNNLQDSADQMENAAITNGYDYWQSAKGLQDSAYNSALANMASARAGTTALVGAAFKGASAAAGGA